MAALQILVLLVQVRILVGQQFKRKHCARGQKVPSFIEMINEKKIAEVVENYLDERGMFIVKLTVSKDNLINIFIDGDQSVTIDDCIKLSRHIEKKYDREVEDYELRVSTAGVDQPFVNPRQYKKNVGRTVEVILKEGNKIRGELLSATEDLIEIQEERTNKNKKSKKTVKGERLQIPMKSIERTRALIIF